MVFVRFYMYFEPFCSMGVLVYACSFIFAVPFSSIIEKYTKKQFLDLENRDNTLHVQDNFISKTRLPIGV